MKQPFIAFICLLLAGCSVFGQHPATPTSTTLISRQKAIDVAVKIALGGAVDIHGALVGPENIQAELTTLGDAMQRLTGSPEVAVGDKPDAPVWLVTMDGLWTDAFPMPTGIPTPMPYHHFTIVMDASAGGLKFLSATR